MLLHGVLVRRIVCVASDSFGFRTLLSQTLEDVGLSVYEIRRDLEGVEAVALDVPSLLVLDALGDAAPAERFLARLARVSGVAPAILMLSERDLYDPSGLVVAQLRPASVALLARLVGALVRGASPPAGDTIH